MIVNGAFLLIINLTCMVIYSQKKYDTVFLYINIGNNNNIIIIHIHAFN